MNTKKILLAIFNLLNSRTNVEAELESIGDMRCPFCSSDKTTQVGLKDSCLSEDCLGLHTYEYFCESCGNRFNARIVFEYNILMKTTLESENNLTWKKEENNHE